MADLLLHLSCVSTAQEEGAVPRDGFSMYRDNTDKLEDTLKYGGVEPFQQTKDAKGDFSILALSLTWFAFGSFYF